MTTAEMLEFADEMRRRGATSFTVQDCDGSVSVEFDPNFAPGQGSSAAEVLARLQELAKED